jgi:hypothetical protein
MPAIIGATTSLRPAHVVRDRASRLLRVPSHNPFTIQGMVSMIKFHLDFSLKFFPVIGKNGWLGGSKMIHHQNAYHGFHNDIIMIMIMIMIMI